jgi:hypothetical protein
MTTDLPPQVIKLDEFGQEAIARIKEIDDLYKRSVSLDEGWALRLRRERAALVEFMEINYNFRMAHRHRIFDPETKCFTV